MGWSFNLFADSMVSDGIETVRLVAFWRSSNFSYRTRNTNLKGLCHAVVAARKIRPLLSVHKKGKLDSRRWYLPQLQNAPFCSGGLASQSVVTEHIDFTDAPNRVPSGASRMETMPRKFPATHASSPNPDAAARDGTRPGKKRQKQSSCRQVRWLLKLDRLWAAL